MDVGVVDGVCPNNIWMVCVGNYMCKKGVNFVMTTDKVEIENMLKVPCVKTY